MIHSVMIQCGHNRGAICELMLQMTNGVGKLRGNTMRVERWDLDEFGLLTIRFNPDEAGGKLATVDKAGCITVHQIRPVQNWAAMLAEMGRLSCAMKQGKC